MRYLKIMLALSLASAVGCSCERPEAPTTTGPRGEAGDEDRGGEDGGEARDLEVDELVGRGTRTPFGLALDVDVDEATLLYPTLIHFGVPADELAKHLPEELAGRSRDLLIKGVQEGLDAAWVGAIARYQRADGALWVMIQDAGWEPTTLNPLHEGWRGNNQDPLADGRPVADVPPPESEGIFFQAPVATEGAHRLVVHAHGPEGAAAGARRALLESIPAAPQRAREEGSTGRSGAYPRSTKLPADDVLAPLADPAALARALPGDLPDGWTKVGEGWGWRREASRNILTGAWRVFATPHGVLVAYAQDLGDPTRPVVLDWSGGGSTGGTADEIRSSVGKSKKTRCSDFFASCKWAKLVDDRVVLSVFGPMGDGKEATTAVAENFDLAAASAAVKGR